MPTYAYKAKKGPAEWVEGQIDAPSRDHAVRRVSELGFVPVQVLEIASRLASSEAAAQAEATREAETKVAQKARFPLFARIRSKDITTFTRQLSILFRSQVPILQSFSILRDRSSNLKMKEMIESLYQDVKDGKPLSQALQKYPDAFPSFYLAMIRSGELSGKLEAILEGLTKFREKEEEFHRRVRGAMAYPIFLLVAGILTIFILLTFVLPRLLVLFKDMEATLPLPTRILMEISDFLSKTWPAFLGIAITGLVLFLTQGRVRRGIKKMLDRIGLRLPLFGSLARNTDMERFTRTLCLLLRSGIPIVQAVESSVSTLDNGDIQKEFHGVSDDMLKGMPLSAALSKIPSFPAFIRDMIAVGEEGGRLEEILEEVANSYAAEIEELTKLVTALLEPMLILVLGIIVGFIVAAMLLPIFQLNMAVQ